MKWQQLSLWITKGKVSKNNSRQSMNTINNANVNIVKLEGLLTDPNRSLQEAKASSFFKKHAKKPHQHNYWTLTEPLRLLKFFKQPLSTSQTYMNLRQIRKIVRSISQVPQSLFSALNFTLISEHFKDLLNLF